MIAGSLGTKNGNGGFAILGIVVAVFGSLAAWLSGLLLYAFGQLVDNSDIIVNQNKRILHTLKCIGTAQTNAPSTPNTIQTQPDLQTETTHQKSEEHESVDDFNMQDTQTTVEHKWRCDYCGNMCNTKYCTVCGTQQPNND
jgi:hypothetical protein